MKKDKKKTVDTEKTYDLKHIRKAVKADLSSKRYEHTLGVEYTAAALAMRYGACLEAARTAGLLHDCAKCISDEKQLKFCRKHGIAISEAEEKAPFLLHAKVGAYLAREKYGVNDPGILSAILHHTTGCENMSLLEKIIFISDYIEPGRKQAPNLKKIRELAFRDLDEALLSILEDTLKYLKASGAKLDPMTEVTWNYYKKSTNVKREDIF